MEEVEIWQPISESDPSRMVASANLALENGASVVVLRMDCISRWDTSTAKHISHAVKGNCHASLRSVWEGGFFSGDEGERVEALQNLVDAGFPGIDVEADMDGAMLRKISAYAKKRNVKVSYNFSSFAWPLPPETLEEMVKGVYNPGDVFFFHAPVKNRDDLSSVIKASRFLRDRGIDATPVGEGRNGSMVSLLAPVMGLPRIRSDFEVMGLDNVEIRRIWEHYGRRNKNIDAEKTHIIGGMAHHGFSTAMPKLYNAIMNDMESDSVYVPMIWGRQKPEELIEMAVDMGLRGFHVEAGLQKPVIGALDTVDKLAKKISAVDTVAIRGDDLVGVNTRYHGFLGLSEEIPFSLRDSSIMVLGSSGELRSAAAAFVDMGARVSYSSPRDQEIEKMKEIFGDDCSHIPWKERQKQASKTDIMVVTPMLKFKEFPIDTEKIEGRRVLIDLQSYSTELHDYRVPGGLIVLGVSDIFPYQASAALSFWTGNEVSSESIFRKLTRSKEKR